MINLRQKFDFATVLFEKKSPQSLKELNNNATSNNNSNNLYLGVASVKILLPTC